MNYLPIEEWGLIISYLPLNDVTEFSCACKDFYRVSRNNSFYLKKLQELKRIFQDKSELSLPVRISVETFTLPSLGD